jgi:hypothetical protein
VRKKEAFKPFLSVVAIGLAFTFISCTGQRNGDDADQSETNTEEVAASDSASSENPVDEKSKPPGDDLTQAASNEGGQPPTDAGKTTDDANKLAANDNHDVKTDDVKADDLTNLENQTEDKTAAASPTAAAPSDAANPPVADAGNPTAVNPDDAASSALAGQAAPDTKTDLDPKLDAGAPATIADNSATLPGPDAGTAAAEPSPVDTVAAAEEKPAHHVKHASMGSSSVPKIPTSAKKIKGDLLNRFYFTRRGDTAASVSALIYGTPDHAKDLSKWNRGAWTPGKLVFYKSPTQSDDGQMRSFFQERNIAPEDYTVQAGDWLSKIALMKLGSKKSWKEIAVVNGLTSGNSLEVGKRIAIYPKDLSAAGSPEVAQPEAPVAVQKPAPKPVPVAQNAQPPVEAQPIIPVPQPVPEEPVAKKPPQKAGAVNVSRLVEQNLFAIAMGVLIFLLVVALLALNKRKKARLDDLAEDGFNPPTKLKRK